jgi:DnaJ-class molecular chaperone
LICPDGLNCCRTDFAISASMPNLLLERDSALDCLEITMANEKGPNVKKKQKCKNCEGKGLLKKGDKVVKCQRCKGTGVR